VYRDFNPGPSHDAFWIFILWRALHGGDATMADIAAAVIANLSQYLPAREDSFGVAPLWPSSKFLAVAQTGESTGSHSESCNSDFPDDHCEPLDEFDCETEPDQTSCATSCEQEELGPHGFDLFCSDPSEFSIYHNYFNFKGVFYRVERPAFACLPTAA
jgi:hypothetical protein